MTSAADRTARVDVVMAARNAAPTLREAVESVRSQTLRDWHLVLVDDGSEDQTREIADAYARDDARIQVVSQAGLGLVAALNRGIAAGRAPLIARMDADDVMRPRRLAQQCDVLDRRNEVGVLGGAICRFGAATGTWRRPLEHEQAWASLLFECPFAHPTVMMRRVLAAGLKGDWYRADFRAAEDLELWQRLGHLTRFANLPDILVDYRAHDGQVTARHRGTMMVNGARVRARHIRECVPNPAPAELLAHEALANLKETSESPDLDAVARWCDRLARYPAAGLSPVIWRHTIGERWRRYCIAVAPAEGGVRWRNFCRLPWAWRVVGGLALAKLFVRRISAAKSSGEAGGS